MKKASFVTDVRALRAAVDYIRDVTDSRGNDAESTVAIIAEGGGVVLRFVINGAFYTLPLFAEMIEYTDG